jgi:hypothetical protein
MHDEFTLDIEAMDALAPANLDASIESLRQSQVDTADARLVRALASVYTLPSGADAVLERVRACITAAPLPDLDSGSDDAIGADAGHPSRPAPRPAPTRPGSRAGAAFRAIAAMLTVALIAGSFLTVLRLHQRAGTSTPTWQDVSITRAHTTQPLNFDPKNGITYAVSQTSANIYACGSGHLWYSADGGATYQPFTPAEPSLPPNVTSTCILATASGLPGVFVFYRDVNTPGQPLTPIGYAAPGALHWQPLPVPAATPYTVNLTPTNTRLPADIVGGVLPYAALAGNVRFSDGWLFALLPIQGQTNVLAGSPDFGASWIWLDATLQQSQGHTCENFAVSSTDSQRLYCNIPAGNPQIWETMDRGQTWEPYKDGTGWETIVGASNNAAFAASNPKPTADSGILMRQTSFGGSWLFVAPLPSPDANNAKFTQGGQRIFEVTPSGGIYEAQYVSDETGTTVQVDSLAPNATKFVSVAHPQQFSGLFGLAFGGTMHGDRPALYLGAGSSGKGDTTTSLYRLALIPTNTPSIINTPLPTLTPAETATPVSTVPAWAPNPACAHDPEILAPIQWGGLGAKASTFVQRWGPANVTSGTTYYGHYSDTGTPVVGVGTGPYTPSNGRVDNMTYHVDKTAHLTLKQAEALVTTIIPKDARHIYIGAPTSTHSPITLGYCSAAFWAAFPPGVTEAGPGEIAVTYWLRADGTVDYMSISAAMFG